MGRVLIYIGIGFIVVGLLWPIIRQLPLGRLPGDIIIEKEQFRLYFPLTSSIVVSLVLSLFFYLFRK
jgi:predicted membrane channel-forming protein YqfA (hemolysin III family)